jgi:hypothetical protein
MNTKIRNLIGILTILLGIVIFQPQKVEAGTYLCNPYNCNPYTCGCRTVTNADKCGTTTTCSSSNSSAGACCGGFYSPPCLETTTGPISDCFSCTAWQKTTANTCTIGCTTCYETCYETCCDELNTAPDQPTSASLTSDEGTYSLSLDENNPTTVNLTNATVTLPEFTQTANSGIGYQFRYYDTEGTLIDTTESTSNTQTIPAGVITTMNTGGTFKISGLYYTVNECDTNKIYSTPLETYITTNNAPNPICTDAECNPTNFIVGLGSDITSKGCQSTTYTGQEINNPLHLNISVTDSDGADDIQGLIVWMSQDENIENTTTIDTNPQESGIEDTAILIRKNGNWTNTPLLYSLNTDNTWTLVSSLIKDTNGTDILRLYDITITESTDINFDFKLEFLGGESGLAGNYNFYAQGLDSALLSDTTVIHDQMVNIFDFGIDLVDPTLENITKNPVDQENITISWNSEDANSGIMTSILNGYASPASGASNIFLNALEISPTEPADQEDRGLFTDVGTTALRLDSVENVSLGIGDNDAGDIYVSITTYDNACNYTNDDEEVSLDPWISTKGGTFYSKEAVSSDAVDISEVAELADKFQRFSIDTVTQGTEVLGSRIRYSYQLIHPELNMVSVTSIYDANNQKTYWFNYINNKIEGENNITNPNDECELERCLYKTTEDITFDSDFTCTGNTVFVSEGNITISPQVVGTVAQNNNTGCIYIAKGDITITNSGHEAITDEIAYDYLEGFFIAENQIIIEAGVTADDRKYGLELEGSLIALGRDNVGGQAIENSRTLKAYNAISPSLLVNYHPKYSKLSTDLVGDEAFIYIQEIAGYKN